MTSNIKTANDFEEIRYLSLQTPTLVTTDGGVDVQVSVLENEYRQSTRWEEVWRLVWHEFNGATYAYYYRIPATEYQESDDEFYPKEIFEVTAKQVTVIQYERKTDAR